MNRNFDVIIHRIANATQSNHTNMKTQLTTLLTIAVLSLTACAEGTKPYPLTTCVVSGEKLGEMGKPVKVTSDGTEVQLCCKSCIKDFNKDPAKYVKLVKDAAAKK